MPSMLSEEIYPLPGVDAHGGDANLHAPAHNRSSSGDVPNGQHAPERHIVYHSEDEFLVTALCLNERARRNIILGNHHVVQCMRCL